MTTAAAPFESLDYLYIPAPDFERAAILEASGWRCTNECDRAWSGRSRDGSTRKAGPGGPALCKDPPYIKTRPT